MMPDYVNGLELLSGIYQKRLFHLAEAFALNERRVKLDPNNLSAQSDWAETHFTTARFAEAETRLATLLANPKLDANTQTALRAIAIANALALGKAATINDKLAALIAAVAQQPADFRVGWSFNGTLHFIGTHAELAKHRDWLQQLIAALQAEKRDDILTALRQVQSRFRP
jgi:tetratricopeptide (TPR) repeat protein